MLDAVARAARVAAAAALMPAAGPAPATIAAPPDPAEVAALFEQACWQGLADPGAFDRTVRSSPLRFEVIDDVLPARHYGDGAHRGTELYFSPGRRCTLRVRLRSNDAAEELVRRISAFAPLEQDGTRVGSPATHNYRSQVLAVGGIGAAAELTFTLPPPPPSPRRPMYPPSFTVSISAYFTPDE